ncbi:MAG: ATP-binding cassette domain-containing protein [Rhodococcus sp. (in: high G+C Gram-positive bacteria)]
MTAASPGKATPPSADTTLHIDARVSRRSADLSLTVPSESVLAVLGPNGAGKSTLLSLAAGLLHPDDGTVSVGSRTLTDVARRTHVAPHRRRIALLAQDPLLFPHLSVVDNVAFAPRSRGDGRGASTRVARQWLDVVGAGNLASRRPRELSGGQAQRVALARALAADPDVLLLDEPFAALDAESAPAMRRVLREVLADKARTTVLVTHDRVDALTLAGHVAVIEGGRVVEHGAVGEVLVAPRSVFAASVVGVNSIAGRFVSQDVLTTPGGVLVHGHADETAAAGTLGVALLHPTAVSVFVDAPVGSPRNVFAVEIDHVESTGSSVRLTSRATGGLPALHADVTTSAATELTLVPGRRVHFVIKAGEVALYPSAGTRT